jgi:hypothetical protein
VLTKRSRVLLIFAALFLSGCGSSKSSSLQPWQRGVEAYLAQRNNDPESLREVTLEDGRRGFAVLGGQDPRKSSDQRALLLAHKPVGDRPWFIYIVGTVNKDVVQDLRLVALSAAGSQTLWRIGPRNATAFKQYRDAAIKDWRDHGGGGGGGASSKSKPPVQYTTFPRASDAFEVTIDGTTVHARHVESGAEFTVDVVQHVPTATTKKSGKTK